MTTALEVAIRRADAIPALPPTGVTIDDEYAMMSRKFFESLPNYTRSIPTGTTIGKCWKRQCFREEVVKISDFMESTRMVPIDVWWMGQFTRELPVPTCCRYHRCIAGYIDKVPCMVVRTREGVVYNPRHPELWPERPNRQTEIRWRKIIIVD